MLIHFKVILVEVLCLFPHCFLKLLVLCILNKYAPPLISRVSIAVVKLEMVIHLLPVMHLLRLLIGFLILCTILKSEHPIVRRFADFRGLHFQKKYDMV